MRKKEIAFLIILTALLVIGYGGNYYWKNYQIQKNQEIAIANEEYTAYYKLFRYFNFEFDIITAKHGTNQITNVREGSFTSERISNYNTWVDYKILKAELHPENEELQIQLRQIRSVNENQDGKITTQDILDNPKNIMTMWNGGPMTQLDTQEIFFRGPIEIIIGSSGEPRLAQQSTW
ncbi:MAG: hypothetical protein FWG40_12050 [Peptococcaceae bacterium]|nr:hypothetical protein [Peptococcaceae bacterium]